MPNIRKIVVGGDESYLAWASAQERSMRRSLEDNKATGRAGAFEPQAGGYRTKKFDMGDGTEIEIRVQPSVSYIIIRGVAGKESSIAYVVGADAAVPWSPTRIEFVPNAAPETINSGGASTNWVSPDKTKYATYIGARLIDRTYRGFADIRYSRATGIGTGGKIIVTNHPVSAACVIDGIGPVYAVLYPPADGDNAGVVELYKANKDTADVLLSTVTLPNVQVNMILSLLEYRLADTAVDGYAVFSPDGKKLGILARPYGSLDGGSGQTLNGFYNTHFAPVLHEVNLTAVGETLSASVSSSSQPYTYGYEYQNTGASGSSVGNRFRLRVPVGVAFVRNGSSYVLNLCYAETYASSTDTISGTEDSDGEDWDGQPIVILNKTGSSAGTRHVKVFVGGLATYSLDWTESASYTSYYRGKPSIGVTYEESLQGSSTMRMAGAYLYDFDATSGNVAFGIYDETKTSTISESKTRDVPGSYSYLVDLRFTYSSFCANASGVWHTFSKTFVVPYLPALGEVPGASGSGQVAAGWGRYLYGGAYSYLFEVNSLWIKTTNNAQRPVVNYEPNLVVNKPFRQGHITSFGDECLANVDFPTPSLNYDAFFGSSLALTVSDFSDPRLLRNVNNTTQNVTAHATNINGKLSICKYPPI